MSETSEPFRLKDFEVEVEVTVRRTLLVPAPDAKLAGIAAEALISDAGTFGASMSAFLKWTDNRRAYRPMPIEKAIGPGRVLQVTEVQITDGET